MTCIVPHVVLLFTCIAIDRGIMHFECFYFFHLNISIGNEDDFMKRTKILSLILALCMVFSLMGAVTATGEDAVEVPGAFISAGTDGIQNGSVILYGKDGAQWLVLDGLNTTTDESGLVLIAKDIVDANIAFNAGGLDNSWENSNAKTWNTEYAAAIFSAAELAGIADTTKAEEAGSYFGGNWSKDALSGEKLFFLSAAEVQDYFGNSVEGLIASCDGVKDGWWLRSAYTDRGIYGGIVSDAGFVGYPHVAATWGARPAFNIAASNVVLTSSAVGGKVSGATGADSLVAVEAGQTDVLKLTVADDAHSGFTATIDGTDQTIGYTSWVLPITYSGAVAGANEYVSMLICDQLGKAVYYGHIAENSASGSVNVNMPVGLSGKYTVSVFAEQCNGDNITDFGSALVSAELNIDDGISSVESWGLTLQGDIRADFLLNVNESVVADPDAYISVTVEDTTVNTKISDITPDSNGRYMVSTNVAAAQMTDAITIQVLTADVAGSEYIYSVRKYGDYILENWDDESVINLVKAMLIYGGSAQNYFAYNLHDMADANISLEMNEIPYTENVAAVKTGSSSKVTYYGSSLVHEHQTSLRFYFKSTDADISNATFTAFVGENVIDTDMKVYKASGMYFVEVADIAPDDLCDMITISVDGLSVSYSPFYYMHRMYYRDTSSDELRNLVAAMYNYYCYAVAHLSK